MPFILMLLVSFVLVPLVLLFLVSLVAFCLFRRNSLERKPFSSTLAALG